MQKYLILRVTHLVSDDFAFGSRGHMKITMLLHSNLAFRNLQCTICIFKTSKMTQIHLFIMNFNKSAVLVDSGFGLGGSLADRRHAAPKDRKYQRVKNQTVLQLEANSLNQTNAMVDMVFLFLGVH